MYDENKIMRRRGCTILSREPIGPDDVRLTVEDDDGEICELFVDGLTIQDCPRHATYDFETMHVWSEMLETEIEAVERLTYRPADRLILAD